MSPDVLSRLRQASNVYGVEGIAITDAPMREQLLEHIVAGNSRQLDDPAFRTELKQWIRFNPRVVAESRDGLFAGCAGNPSLPSWIAPVVFNLVVSTKGENQKCVEQVRSSSGMMVFVAASEFRRALRSRTRDAEIAASADGRCDEHGLSRADSRNRKIDGRNAEH